MWACLIPVQITWCQIAPLLRGKTLESFGTLAKFFSFASDWPLGICFASSAFSRICLLHLSYWPLKTYLTLTLHLTSNNSSCLLPLGCLNMISNLSCLKSNIVFPLKFSPFLEIFFSVNGEIFLVQTYISPWLFSLSTSHNPLPDMVRSTFDSYHISTQILFSFLFPFIFFCLTIFWTSDVLTDLRVCPLFLSSRFCFGFVLSRKISHKTFAYRVPFNH